MSEVENDQEKYEILNLAWELYFKIILFIVAILIFISLAITFIYTAVKAYDPILVVSVGVSDGVFGFVILHITRSLFKPK